jgi:hypothetical protein
VTQPSYTPPSWVNVADPDNPPANAVAITAERLTAMGSAIAQAISLANEAQNAVTQARLVELIQDTVGAMVQNATYDDTSGTLTIGGGSVPITTPTTTPTAEVYVETYNANAGTGADDTVALNAAFAAAGGKEVKFVTGKTYRAAGQLNVTADNVTLNGNGARLLSTTETNCALKWTGDNGVMKNLTREGVSTVRGVNYETNILLLDGANNFTADNVLSLNSAGTGWFITRTVKATFTNCTVRNSRADGFHVTGGSSYVTMTDCLADGPGDDGFANVSYVGNSDGGMVNNNRFTRCKVINQTVRGRGFTVVGGEDITFENFSSDGTWGPGIYVASEPYGNNPTYGVARVKYLGGTLRNSHSTREISNGSICIASSRPGFAINDVTIQGVTTYNTRSDLPFEIGAYTEGGTITRLILQGIKAVAGSTGQLLFTNLATTDYTQTDVTKATSGAGASTINTTVRVTSTQLTTSSATVAWAPVAGTDGVTLSGVSTTIDGGSATAGSATGSRAFTGLTAGSAHTVSIQPLVGGNAYGTAVTTSFTVPATTPTATVLTSDTFTGSGELIGRSTDIAAGGTAMTWAGDANNALAVANGRLTRGANNVNVFAGVLTNSMNVEAKVTLVNLPTGDGIFLDLHRATATSDYTVTRYEAQVIVTGALRLTKCTGGTITVLGEAGTIGNAAAGDTVILRYAGGRIILLVNGTTAASVADTSITTPGYAGLAIPQTTTGLSLDNFVLSATA